MEQPKVSIIIPVYNVETYLIECLNSAINQNYSNKEIIIINDGSTDSSSYLLKEFKHNNPELILIETNNRGQSCARNTGIDIATGEYIIFLDSDDWIEKSTLARCIDALKTHQVDIVMFSAKSFTDGLHSNAINLFNYKHHPSLLNKKTPSKIFFTESFKLRNYIVSPCLYLYKKTHLSSVKFLPGIIHEDNLFTTTMLLKRNDLTVVCIADELYNRRIRPDSIMTQKKIIAHTDGYLSVAENLLKLISPDENKNITNAFNSFIQHMIVNSIDTCRLANSNKFPINMRIKCINILRRIHVRDIKLKSIAYVIIPELTIFKALIIKKFKKNESF